MNYQDLTIAQKTIFKDTFVKFLVRDMDFTLEEAKFELNFLLINGMQVLEGYYILYTPRLGSTKILNRVKKREVYQTMLNAINHASFE